MVKILNEISPRRLRAGYGIAILVAMALIALLAAAMLPRPAAAAETTPKLAVSGQNPLATYQQQILYTPVEHG